MESTYTPPEALTILAGIFLISGAICMIGVASDIIIRRGWRSMMWIMIPVYIINAAYMGPITVWVYLKYGRPAKPSPSNPEGTPSCHAKESAAPNRHNEQSTTPACHAKKASVEPTTDSNSERTASEQSQKPSCHSKLATPDHSNDQQTSDHCHSTPPDPEKQDAGPSNASHCAHHSAASTRPFFVTLLIGVSHCGAGCVLGDIVGEWLVYGTNASIRGRSIWAELLIDYAFALIFGIVFQFFSIAPMSGEYGPRTVWRAAKADVLSLTSFEVGAFGWMVIYQVGIWDYRLEMMTWVYWWMMQMGMAMGFATALPMNWFLLRWKIKEPCC